MNYFLVECRWNYWSGKIPDCFWQNPFGQNPGLLWAKSWSRWSGGGPQKSTKIPDRPKIPGDLEQKIPSRQRKSRKKSRWKLKGKPRAYQAWWSTFFGQVLQELSVWENPGGDPGLSTPKSVNEHLNTSPVFWRGVEQIKTQALDSRKCICII